ncbi:MAG: glycosyltransferase [Actinomycetota bacterium]|nr:glycosyltransferase [Actinomycetota bacterium]
MLRPQPLDRLDGDPLVSILMANYNYARYLPQALDSALRQTYPHVEIIVCDDGSTDGSIDVLRRFAAKSDRVEVIEKENGGYVTAINAAYERSRGHIISILDADDVFTDDKVEVAVEALRRDAGLHCHQLEPVDESTGSIGPPLPKRLSDGWLAENALDRGGEASFAPSSGISFRREIADMIFPLPEGIRRGGDWYIARAAQFVTPVAATLRPLALYRVHGSNATGLWSADLKTLRGFIDDNEMITRACRDFLRRVYGDEVADRFHDEDRPSYWEARLGLKVLDPAASDGRLSVRGLKEKVPDPKRRAMWTLVLATPRPIARRLLSAWWDDSATKRLLKSRSSRGVASTNGDVARIKPSLEIQKTVLEPMKLTALGDDPLVSVLIANYNYARFLPDAVRSAASQTYGNVEVVVCDDGSTDDSRAVLERLERDLERVTVVAQDNQGQSAALSRAFSASKGEIVTLLDADDFMREDKAQKIVDAFRSQPEAGMVVHQMMRVDSNGAGQGVYPLSSALPEGWLGLSALGSAGYVPWIEAGIMSLRRAVADRIFPLPAEAGQFADVILRGAGAMLAPIAAVREPLAYYRLHGANVGNAARRFDRDEMLERRRRDLDHLKVAYSALAEWAERNLEGAVLVPFERTRPYLERRYVLARLAGEAGDERRRLLSRLLAQQDALSPRLRAFYRISPLLPRAAFKAGLELAYGQGRFKAAASRVVGGRRA